MAARLPVHRATASLIAMLVAGLALAACGDQAPSDTPELLARDPERLQVVLRQCRADPVRSDGQIRRGASEAWRRRFFANERAHASPSSALRSPVAQSPSATEPTPWMAGS